MPDENGNLSERPIVAVYGAGVAGLTAAHELAVRGFDVYVIEPRADPRQANPMVPQVGGVARTQWSAVPSAADQPARLQTARAFPLEHDPQGDEVERRLLELPRQVRFDASGTVPDEATMEKVRDYLRENPWLERVNLYGLQTEAEKNTGAARARVEAVRNAILPDRTRQEQIQQERRPTEAERDAGLPYPPGDGGDIQTRIAVYALESFEAEEARVDLHPMVNVLPGEHGYRFFPSFYRHLLDTMNRTPLLELDVADALEQAKREERWNQLQGAGAVGPGTADEYRVTRDTAFDNLISLPKHAIARTDDNPPWVLDRTRAKSITEVLRELDIMLRRMNFTMRDISLFQLTLFRFATSCGRRRRDEYGDLSWSDFVELDRFSPKFAEAMNRWPLALVGLRSDECDAHTQGIVTIQLMIDQMGTSYTDGTLNGPSSEAWLDAWQLYLQEQFGVTFLRGQLDNLTWDAASGRVKPEVTAFYDTNANDTISPPFAPEYIVCALPSDRVHRVIDDSLLAHAEATGATELQRTRDFSLAVDTGELKDSNRIYSGIQFYFDTDVYWVDGHMYFPDSAWALSSISQARYHFMRFASQAPFRGIVSVVIGDFDSKGQFVVKDKSASECSPDEIAAEVWAQIHAAVIGEGEPVPPVPVYYHLDDDLVFDATRTSIVGSESRYLVNTVDSWEPRPGDPDEYELLFDQLVFAGSYMKTHTRLVTMESANESARLAVNAILDHRADETTRANRPMRVGTRCGLWPLEQREPPDMSALKELDARLYARGRAHFADILGLEAVPDFVFSRRVGQPHDALVELMQALADHLEEDDDD